ncbi:MAG TPA: DinB family protein [Ktedonobacteraceae bacterium]|nr:DinB family protein [Ktedonobacteraceae bacterium]
MLDFAPVRNRTTSLVNIAQDLTKEDLCALTNEMIDTMQEITTDAIDADVVFVPQDPEANDTFGIPEEADLAWTLGHVIVHATASSEESAALALTLARGLPVDGRSRYETPWRAVHTVAQIRHRLEESRHMRLAMLDAWPDEPHLDVTYAPYPGRPPYNAIARFISGLYHDDAHLDQLREIMRQCRVAQPR